MILSKLDYENMKYIIHFFQAHKTVLEKHKIPDDVIPGIKNVKEPLPSVPISGMYNKSGGKVRLTFKLELDQIWLGTKGIYHNYEYKFRRYLEVRSSATFLKKYKRNK